jgi:hypothetical protein
VAVHPEPGPPSDPFDFGIPPIQNSSAPDPLFNVDFGNFIDLLTGLNLGVGEQTLIREINVPHSPGFVDSYVATLSFNVSSQAKEIVNFSPLVHRRATLQIFLPYYLVETQGQNQGQGPPVFTQELVPLSSFFFFDDQGQGQGQGQGLGQPELVENALWHFTISAVHEETPVPEPATVFLLSTGLAGLICCGYRRRTAG